MAGPVDAEYRQVTVVDHRGRGAHFTGARTLGTNAVAIGAGCIGAGNLLRTEAVPAAMVEVFQAEHELHLAARLLRALEAGLAAGGEEGPVHSAALLVADEQPWPLVDLRVDWDERDPIARPARPLDGLSAADAGLRHARARPRIRSGLRRAGRPMSVRKQQAGSLPRRPSRFPRGGWPGPNFWQARPIGASRS